MAIAQDVGGPRRIADLAVMLWQGRIIGLGPQTSLTCMAIPFVDHFVRGRISAPIRFDEQWMLSPRR